MRGYIYPDSETPTSLIKNLMGRNSLFYIPLTIPYGHLDAADWFEVFFHLPSQENLIMALTWNKGILKRTKQVTPNTRLFYFEIQGMDSFDFKPGQFVTLDLPVDDTASGRWKSFSISSAPDGTNEIELVIVHVEGGPGSTYLFKEMKIGDEVPVRGPQGIFTLPKKLDRDIYFVCTGTGIAPFRSMLEYIRLNKIEINHNIYMIFGTRRQEDLLYAEDMKIYEKEIPHFTYIPTLSREKWEGEMGYVHPIYEKLAKDQPEAYFFLCGWKEMIREATQRIRDMGYERRYIRKELFG